MTIKRLLVAVPALVGLSLATVGVKAQTGTPATEAAVADAVELKNGGYLRGLIVEVEPGSHVTLRLADGQVRRIAIAELESAERAGNPLDLSAPATQGPVAPPGATAVPVAPLAATATSPAANAPDTAELAGILAKIPGPRIKLQAQANVPGYLERRIGEEEGDAVGYHLVCKLPCSAELPAADAVPYRLSSLRFQPTAWFQLPKYNARVRADLVSGMWPVWTRSMLVGGLVFGAVGGSMYGINEATGKKPWAHDTGLVLIGVGGVFLVASGLFWLFSPHTSYALERAP